MPEIGIGAVEHHCAVLRYRGSAPQTAVGLGSESPESIDETKIHSVAPVRCLTLRLPCQERNACAAASTKVKQSRRKPCRLSGSSYFSACLPWPLAPPGASSGQSLDTLAKHSEPVSGYSLLPDSYIFFVSNCIDQVICWKPALFGDRRRGSGPVLEARNR